jgi:tagatose 1,6-diphosphate aldolase
MRQISMGKYRGIQRATTPNGHFVIVALDHHDAMRRALNAAAPETVTDEEMTAFKLQVARAFEPEVSALLLDPIYSAGQAIVAGIVSRAGLLVEMEKAGYAMQPLPLICQILPEWTVAKIKRMGSDGVKLFFYYNIADEPRAREQELLLTKIAADCAAYDLPFYAEPILYPFGEPEEVYAANYTERIIGAARRMEALGADVLKMEFPLQPSRWNDAAAGYEACAALTNATTIPWVLLSAGVDFETFCGQIEIACKAGASGVIVGRALWGEAAQITNPDAREAWLQTTGRDRLRRLASLTQTGKPWTERLAPLSVTTDWHQQYEGMPKG